MFKSLISHKLTLLFLLFLLLQLPLHSLQSLTYERQSYRNQALEQISASSSGPQRLVGPILVIPYQQQENQYNEQEGKYHVIVQQRQLLLLPEQLTVNSTLQVESRQLGIYQAQLFNGPLQLSGHFAADGLAPLLQDEQIAIGTPYLTVLVTDARGLLQVPRLKWGDASLPFQPGARLGSREQGIHAPVSLATLQSGHSQPFAFELTLQGSGSLEMVPVGASSTLTLHSNWPHPSFIGQFLPRERQIDSHGFRAHWESSWFANNLQERIQELDQRGSQALPAFTVSLIEPVDHYQQNNRALKYAELFIGLTFLSFFLFELVKRLRLHPIQYALVSLAQIVFYLVLLALSEQIGFSLAYLLASIACVGLLSFYACFLLGSLLRGLGFACLLSLLYAILYGLMQAEDLALLLGSGLLFIALALVMVITRHVDWYRLGRRQAGDDTAQDDPGTAA